MKTALRYTCINICREERGGWWDSWVKSAKDKVTLLNLNLKNSIASLWQGPRHQLVATKLNYYLWWNLSWIQLKLLKAILITNTLKSIWLKCSGTDKLIVMIWKPLQTIQSELVPEKVAHINARCMNTLGLNIVLLGCKTCSCWRVSQRLWERGCRFAIRNIWKVCLNSLKLLQMLRSWVWAHQENVGIVLQRYKIVFLIAAPNNLEDSRPCKTDHDKLSSLIFHLTHACSHHRTCINGFLYLCWAEDWLSVASSALRSTGFTKYRVLCVLMRLACFWHTSVSDQYLRDEVIFLNLHDLIKINFVWHSLLFLVGVCL